MAGQNENDTSDEEVELTSLITNDDGVLADGTGAVSSTKDGILADTASPTNALGSRAYSASDYLVCLTSFIGGIIAVAILLFGISSKRSLHIGGLGGPPKNNSKGVSNNAAKSFEQARSWKQMRWRPMVNADIISEDDNCVGGFRLANSTIHCGIGEMIPLTNASDGSKLCGGIKMEPNLCYMTKFGEWVVPEGGSTLQPLPHRYGMIENSTKSQCTTVQQLSEGSFEGEGLDKEWIPKSCNAIPLNPFVWTENAECQTTITMLGDSHIRNLYHATMYGLRGVEAFVEGHNEYGKAGGEVRSYEWRLEKDGHATDEANVFYNTNREEPIPFTDCPCDEVKRCLRLSFIWAPTFGEQLKQIHLAEKWNSDLVIVEPGNSYEGSVALSPSWATKFDEMMKQNHNLHLGILHFSWGKQPGDRPAVLANWTMNGTHADRMSYFKQGDMTVSGSKQSGSTWHFACGLGKVDVVNDAIKAVEPCTDLADTAQIRSIMTYHFNIFTDTV